MLTRIKVALAAVLLAGAAIAADEPEARTVTAWTMIRGCPYPHHPHPYVVVLTFSDGHVFTYTDDLPAEQRDAIRKVLGDMEGRIFQFQCGTQS